MSPQVRSARPHRSRIRRLVVPGSAYVRVLCCSHTRVMWQMLMLLIVLCVALQLLSSVRQSWNYRVSAPIRQQLLLQTHSDCPEEHMTSNRAENGISETETTHRTARVPTPSGPQQPIKLAPKKQDPNHPNLENPPPLRRPHQATIKQSFCPPKTHIVFLKTHKTASSTILNILYRYGESRNLTFALPLKGNSQLFYPQFFRAHYVEGVMTGTMTHFHILCNHMRFKAQEVKKVMPTDTFYFSILRSPISMMESLFTYYKLIPAFSRFKTLEDFLLDGGRSYNASWPGAHYARNVLTFDLGEDSSGPADEAELDRRTVSLISAVESRFHLVLISEFFDESMVLLKHALCWTLEDVLSFRLNSRSERSRRPLSPEMADLVKGWSSLDWRLYRHFNTSFWHRVETSLGRAELQREVLRLRARRAQLQRTCLLEGVAVDPGLVRDSLLKPFQYGQAVIQGYNLHKGLDNATQWLCERLVTPELQYTSLLYAKQFPELAAKHAVAAREEKQQIHNPKQQKAKQT